MNIAEKAVSVKLAGPSEKVLIEGLSQFYIYDFSEIEPADSARFEFNAHGGFDPLPGLDDYWRADGCRPLLIRIAERPAGFVLLNARSHRGESVAHNVGEFFIARKYRRTGVATTAFRQLLTLYPGRWEVAVAERNVAAGAFWPKAIAAAPQISQILRAEGDGVQWRGPIWSFSSGF